LRLVQLSAVLFLALGCQDSPPTTPKPAVATDPRSSLDEVIQRFRRRYGGGNGASAIRSETQLAKVRIVPEVTYLLHEPDALTDAYTAEVTIRNTIHFTVLGDRPAPAEPEDAEPAGAEPSPDDIDSSLQVRTEEFSETYDLVYEQDRWVLKTQELDESVRRAFEYALRDQ
jgi:hypothetical protein